jgi:hypothetical protein
VGNKIRFPWLGCPASSETLRSSARPRGCPSTAMLFQAITENVTSWAAVSVFWCGGSLYSQGECRQRCFTLPEEDNIQWSGMLSWAMKQWRQLEKQYCFYLPLILLLFFPFLHFLPRNHFPFPFPSFLPVSYILSLPLFSHFNFPFSISFFIYSLPTSSFFLLICTSLFLCFSLLFPSIYITFFL